jgi:methylmalonyl-CoA mutase N-terminal domain/subunit
MKTAERQFTTISGVPVDRVYGPDNYQNPDPGEFPYTRGIHRDMYRGKLWTMRQFSGFATPEETNQRYHYLLAQGQTGLSVAFDLPTLMGYDADHALSEGEVGKCGAPISSLEDMEILLRGIPLGDVSVSMTINSPASVIWAMYLAVAEQQGVPWERLAGTLQNDILKEYIAQKEYIYPPRASMRLVTDTIEFGAKHTPKFNPVSISGYHIREAGSTAVQELAFTLRDGIEYVDWALERGLAIDDFAPLLQRAQRFLRGDRQVPRRPQDLGTGDARPLRGAERAQPETTLPRADCRMFTDLAAALQQRGAYCLAGHGRSAGRRAIAAHQFAG